MTQINISGIDPKIEQEIRKISCITWESIDRVILKMICNYKGFAG
jgi:hypothetical protein